MIIMHCNRLFGKDLRSAQLVRGRGVYHGKKLKALENQIGVIQEQNLPDLALTHSSYANEKKRLLGRLQRAPGFLGDAVLELIPAVIFFIRNSPRFRGRIDQERASLVYMTILLIAEISETPSVCSLERLQDMTGGRNNDSIVSDTTEGSAWSYLSGQWFC